MSDFYFYHNIYTCIGCCACQAACKDHNNLPPGEFFRRVAEIRDPDTGKHHFYSGNCNHCESPVCVAVCPNGAFYQAEDGTVLHDDGKCIGCGKCLWSCPYGAISLSRERGVAQKCSGCLERRRQGQEPACVAACVNRSLQFGRTDGRCDERPLLRTIPGILPDAELTRPRLRIPVDPVKEQA